MFMSCRVLGLRGQSEETTTDREHLASQQREAAPIPEELPQRQGGCVSS